MSSRKVGLSCLITALIVLLLFPYGCTTTVEKVSIPNITFEPTPNFEGFGEIKKPERVDPIAFLDKNFQKTTSMSNVEYFVFNKKGLASITALSDAFNAQQDLIQAYIVETNLRVEQINTLKELIATQQCLSDYLATMYKMEREARLEDSKDHDISDAMNKLLIVIQAGVIIALAVL